MVAPAGNRDGLRICSRRVGENKMSRLLFAAARAAIAAGQKFIKESKHA